MKNIVFLILLYSIPTFAFSDVTCWKNDCLKNGWTWSNFDTSSHINFSCYRDGCKTSGWIAQGSGAKHYTQCKPEGCFKEGWYDVSSDTQNMRYNVVCRSKDEGPVERDCLKYGWVIYSTRGQEAVMTCHQKDCAKKGWLIQTSYGLTQVHCKAGGCWHEGWTEN
jgi:hypothetical protein